MIMTPELRPRYWISVAAADHSAAMLQAQPLLVAVAAVSLLVAVAAALVAAAAISSG